MRYVWMGLAACAVLGSGCATLFNPFQPGARVTPQVADRWGCEYGQVMGAAEQAKEALEIGKNWIPQVGWTACRVLAFTGAPTEVDLQQSSLGRSANWWFRGNSDVHLVTLEQQGSQWVVDYVGW